jgi:hypothetical protein
MKLRHLLLIATLVLSSPCIAMAGKPHGYLHSLATTLEELPNVSAVLKEPVHMKSGGISRSGHLTLGTVAMVFQFTGESMDRLTGATILTFTDHNSSDADIQRAAALSEMVIRGLFHNSSHADQVIAWMSENLSRQTEVLLVGGTPKDDERVVYDGLLKIGAHKSMLGGNLVTTIFVTTDID